MAVYTYKHKIINSYIIIFGDNEEEAKGKLELLVLGL